MGFGLMSLALMGVTYKKRDVREDNALAVTASEETLETSKSLLTKCARKNDPSLMEQEMIGDKKYLSETKESCTANI